MVSTKKTADGIEQIDLMPDGNLRRAFWKGAKTLDDLRKVPDEVSRCEKYVADGIRGERTEQAGKERDIYAGKETG